MEHRAVKQADTLVNAVTAAGIANADACHKVVSATKEVLFNKSSAKDKTYDEKQ